MPETMPNVMQQIVGVLFDYARFFLNPFNDLLIKVCKNENSSGSSRNSDWFLACRVIPKLPSSF
jgi:hypothetical protein